MTWTYLILPHLAIHTTVLPSSEHLQTKRTHDHSTDLIQTKHVRQHTSTFCPNAI